MLNFLPVAADAEKEIGQYLEYYHFRMCDYTFITLYLWRNFFDTEYCVSDDVLYLRHNNFGGKRAYLFPIGHGDIDGAVRNICGMERKTVFCAVSKEDSERIESITGRQTIAKKEEGWSDYLYLKDEISSFSGKKFHGQKNHVNHFKKTFPDYNYVKITKDNAADAAGFFKTFLAGAQSDLERTELKQNIDFFENFGAVESFADGGFIECGGKILACSLSEVVGDTLFIHVERAQGSIKGAYQTMFMETSRRAPDKVVYLNREEDCGDEGLRTSKMSYHPINLIDKYTVYVR